MEGPERVCTQYKGQGRSPKTPRRVQYKQVLWGSRRRLSRDQQPESPEKETSELCSVGWGSRGRRRGRHGNLGGEGGRLCKKLRSTFHSARGVEG